MVLKRNFVSNRCEELIEKCTYMGGRDIRLIVDENYFRKVVLAIELYRLGPKF